VKLTDLYEHFGINNLKQIWAHWTGSKMFALFHRGVLHFACWRLFAKVSVML